MERTGSLDEAGQSPKGERTAENSILGTMEAQAVQVRSGERVRALAEVFTHQREVDAILDSVSDAFLALDIKFLEPASGSGNFLVEILIRKLKLVVRNGSANQEHFEHRLLRAVASIYGVDISHENVVEARGRLAHTLLEHYRMDANTAEPTVGFVQGAAVILDANVVHGNTLADAGTIDLCDWQPHSHGRFRRVWSNALVPEHERDLFWAECAQDDEPVHYSELAGTNRPSPRRKSGTKR
ncbi:hypothetical protein [Arthrobacter rhombi]|uniref:hypothetical protein n=1 Tax=Arthrobacter rhombi TaxID=71253 RepID=UPI003FD57424